MTKPAMYVQRSPAGSHSVTICKIESMGCAFVWNEKQQGWVETHYGRLTARLYGMDGSADTDVISEAEAMAATGGVE